MAPGTWLARPPWGSRDTRLSHERNMKTRKELPPPCHRKDVVSLDGLRTFLTAAALNEIPSQRIVEVLTMFVNGVRGVGLPDFAASLVFSSQKLSPDTYRPEKPR